MTMLQPKSLSTAQTGHVFVNASWRQTWRRKVNDRVSENGGRQLLPSEYSLSPSPSPSPSSLSLGPSADQILSCPSVVNLFPARLGINLKELPLIIFKSTLLNATRACPTPHRPAHNRQRKCFSSLNSFMKRFPAMLKGR